MKYKQKMGRGITRFPLKREDFKEISMKQIEFKATVEDIFKEFIDHQKSLLSNLVLVIAVVK